MLEKFVFWCCFSLVYNISIETKQVYLFVIILFLKCYYEVMF